MKFFPLAIQLLLLLCLACSVQAQLEQVTHEVYFTDDGSIAGYPAGYTTYRIYAELASAQDELCAVYAADGNTLILGGQESPIWNSPFGGITGPEVNAAFFGFFPEMEMDSFVTIGRANNGDAGAGVSVVEAVYTVGILDGCGSAGTPFSPTIYVEEGGWSTDDSAANCFGMGSNNRVLLAQLTTEGDLTYALNVVVNVFEDSGAESFYVWNPATAGDATVNPTLVYPDVLFDGAGCTDPTACNYNPLATLDDGSCTGVVGCTDPAACNYDPLATCIFTACFYPGDFCDDGDPDTGADTVLDDCTCVGIPIVLGCTAPSACNFDPLATFEDGSCLLPGCMDELACNYFPWAGCDDGSCLFGPVGCTDSEACNFDPLAVCLNGTCTYPGCDDPFAVNYTSYGGCPGPCTYMGCMDALACNYLPEANVDSGMCTYPGCTDPNACNFNPAAGCDDGSCDGEVVCADPTACNYSPLPGTDCADVCTYAGCTDPAACNFDPLAGCEDAAACFFDNRVQLTYALTGIYGFFNSPLFGNVGSWEITELGLTFEASETGELDLGPIPPGTYQLTYTDGTGNFAPEYLTETVLTFPLCSPATISMESVGDLSLYMVENNTYTPERTVSCLYATAATWEVHNDGSEAFDYTYALNFDPDWSPSLSPTSLPETSSGAGTMSWEGVLNPSWDGRFEVNLAPPVTVVDGEVMPISAELVCTSATGETWFNLLHDQNWNISCSYDPNYLEVLPPGYASPEFITAGTPLEYTVHFQNVGSAAAADVLIEQTLNPEGHNMATLTPLAASHDFEWVLEESGQLNLLFENIQLPDSTSDPLGSQGWLRFSVETYASLEQDDLLQSTASIYFDFNAPIVTNTTTRTVMDCDQLAAFAPVSEVYCEGDVLEVNSLSLDYVEEHQWYLGGWLFSESSAAQITLPYGEPLPLSYVASNPICVDVESTTVDVLAPPEAGFTVYENTLVSVPGQAYQWYYNGVPIPGATDQEYEITTDGSYSVAITDFNGCTTLSGALNLLVVGLEELTEDFVMYPMPTRDLLTVELPSRVSVQWQLSELSGREVCSGSASGKRWELDLRALPAGLYLLKVEWASGQFVQRRVLKV